MNFGGNKVEIYDLFNVSTQRFPRFELNPATRGDGVIVPGKCGRGKSAHLARLHDGRRGRENSEAASRSNTAMCDGFGLEVATMIFIEFGI